MRKVPPAIHAMPGHADGSHTGTSAARSSRSAIVLPPESLGHPPSQVSGHDGHMLVPESAIGANPECSAGEARREAACPKSSTRANGCMSPTKSASGGLGGPEVLRVAPRRPEATGRPSSAFPEPIAGGGGRRLRRPATPHGAPLAGPRRRRCSPEPPRDVVLRALVLGIVEDHL